MSVLHPCDYAPADVPQLCKHILHMAQLSAMAYICEVLIADLVSAIPLNTHGCQVDQVGDGSPTVLLSVKGKLSQILLCDILCHRLTPLAEMGLHGKCEIWHELIIVMNVRSFYLTGDCERRVMLAIFLLANRIYSSAKTSSLIGTGKQEETRLPLDWCILAVSEKTAFLTNFCLPHERLNIV